VALGGEQVRCQTILERAANADKKGVLISSAVTLESLALRHGRQWSGASTDRQSDKRLGA